MTKTSCVPCDHTQKHGYLGDLPDQATSHCQQCHRNWSSAAEAHCCGCHNHFTSNRAFDQHRTLGQCLNPTTELRNDGRRRFEPRQRKHGVSWALAYYGEPFPETLSKTG